MMEFFVQTVPFRDPADLRLLRDITGIESVPPADDAPRWLFWFGVAFIALGVCGLAYAIGRRLLGKSRQESPERWAERELDQLAADAPSDGDFAGDFHERLGEIVRRFLRQRYELPAPWQTTNEFLQGTHAAEVLGVERWEQARELLGHCDLAKFARARFSAEDSRQALATARQLIHGQPSDASRIDTSRVTGPAVKNPGRIDGGSCRET